MLAVLMLAIFTQLTVSAQAVQNGEEEVSAKTTEATPAERQNTKALEGSWNIQVTGRNCRTGDPIRTFPSMFTFMRGGTMTEWGSGNPPATRG
jgi:hypothetical protein